MDSTLNPYESPHETNELPQVDLRKQLTARLGVPSLGLLMVSGLGFVFWMILMFGWFAISLPHLGGGGMADGEAESILCCGLTFGGAFAALHFGVALAAYRMSKLESLAICRMGAFLACIPILSPLFVLGIPFGIWALVVLLLPGTAAQFDRVDASI